jgi:UDP-2,3-diacylglucosamine pyrophosphatase LpxH
MREDDMDLAQMADLADVLAGFGVIASLLFVAYELRKNTAEATHKRWESLVDRHLELFRQTSGEGLADVILRGREDYDALSASDRIVFGDYYNQFVETFETIVVAGRDQVHGDELKPLVEKYLQTWFRYPGARQWWKEFSVSLGVSPRMEKTVNAAIGTSD